MSRIESMAAIRARRTGLPVEVLLLAEDELKAEYPLCDRAKARPRGTLTLECCAQCSHNLVTVSHLQVERARAILLRRRIEALRAAMMDASAMVEIGFAMDLERAVEVLDNAVAADRAKESR